MGTVKTVSVIREYNPQKDLVNIQELCDFGAEALQSNVSVLTTYRSGLAEPATKGGFYRTSTKSDGTQVCRGVYFLYTIRSQKMGSYATGIGIPFGGTVVVGVEPGKLEIAISYELYEAPPTETPQYNTTPPAELQNTPSSTPPAAADGDGTQATKYITEIVPETQEEWVAKQIIKGGINRKVRNTYSIDTLGESEDLDPEEIINDLIPDNDTADRIGKLAIIQSEKNKAVQCFPAVNFDLDLCDLLEAEASFQALEFKEQIESQFINTYPSGNFADKFSITFFGRGD